MATPVSNSSSVQNVPPRDPPPPRPVKDEAPRPEANAHPEPPRESSNNSNEPGQIVDVRA